MKQNPILSAVIAVWNHTCNGGYRQATKFLTPKLVVRATRRFKPDRREKNNEVVLTMGRPNYTEREFIKLCQKVSEPFPVKNIRLKGWGDNRKRKK